MLGSQYLMAIDVARTGHQGQLRKYTKEPYIVHPFAVAGLVAAVTRDDDMIIAAMLHDTVEDTPVTIELIRGLFGERVAGFVSDLTDVSNPSDGNRKVRKEIDRDHTAQASPSAKTIKLADLIDNTKSITAYDANFARIYMREKQALLGVLQGGNSALVKIANDLVRDYYSKGAGN